MEEKPICIAPCNIGPNNTLEVELNWGRKENQCICVRYKCGKIKWKKKGYRKSKWWTR